MRRSTSFRAGDGERGALQRGGVAVCAAVLGVCLVACDRSPPSSAPTTTQYAEVVPMPAQPPECSLAEGLAQEFPEVAAFVDRFMQTCAAGDYTGYRRMVTRVADPESRGRFEAVLHALRSLRVETIEVISLPDIRSAYLVVARVELDPESTIRLRRADIDQVAILVFEEEGELRMTIAPTEYQPRPEHATTQGAEPATQTAPSYPWNEDVDF